jgi:hypothetical protein
MTKQGDRKARRQRAQAREQRRRQASGNREPGPEAFGIKMPPPAAPGSPAQRPDYSETDWDALRATYPRDAERVKRAMFIAFVGERAKQAKDFLAWGLRPNPIHPESRFARDNAAVELDDEPNLVSSTALFPTMNASEHLVAAAEVIALALSQGQMRTSALAALCRIAMESSAKTIWLIREPGTDERLRRCYGFIKGERGRQEQFEGLEAEALAARIDPLAGAQRIKFEKHRERSAARHEQIQALPAEALTVPPGPLELVEYAEDWMDEHLPREPDPELGKVIHPRSAKSFYALSSGFVHGFKWQAEYLFEPAGELDDSGLLEVTLDALGNAIRMTRCAVALHEAQSVGSRPDPRRARNYPTGLADYVKDLSPLYQL